MPRRVKTSPFVAVAYLRVSTDRQDLGPEAQRESITAFAARSSVSVAAWHLDQLSGSTEGTDRPGLLAALTSLRTHKAGVLYIARRDRLARDVSIAITIDRAVTAAGAVIVSADGSGNGEGPSDKFIRTVLDAASAHERDLIRHRTKAALAVKIRAGEYMGGPSQFGYANVNGLLVPDVAEQAVISRALALRAEGMPFRGVVTALATEGYRSRVGRPLALSQIQNLLRLAARKRNVSK